MANTKDCWWAVVIGSGLAILPIHNQWLTNLTTNDAGETLFFLPAFGYLLLIMGSGLFLLNNWGRVKEVGIGSKWVTIPLLGIAISISLSGITADGISAKFAPMGMALSLLAVYLVGRLLGSKLFIPLFIGAMIASIGIFLRQAMYPGRATGGLIFEYNYDVATGYIVMGTILVATEARDRYRYLIIAVLPLTALLISGSAEALFVIGVLGIAVLIRRDWGIKTSIVALSLVVIALGIVFIPSLQQTHRLTAWAITNDASLAPVRNTSDGLSPIGKRWVTITQELSTTPILGKGYNVTNFSAVKMVHNVPLVIVQQLGWPGVVAGIAWLFVSIWCLAKTKMKYAWVSILALSVWDHYIWTQMAPLWWVVAGVSLNNGEEEYIFKN